MQPGVLVQLVRIPACHAGGRVFESRTHRHKGDIRKGVSRCFLFHTITHSPCHEKPTQRKISGDKYEVERLRQDDYRLTWVALIRCPLIDVATFPTPHEAYGLCAAGLPQFKAAGLAVVFDLTAHTFYRVSRKTHSSPTVYRVIPTRLPTTTNFF